MEQPARRTGSVRRSLRRSFGAGSSSGTHGEEEPAAALTVVEENPEQATRAAQEGPQKASGDTTTQWVPLDTWIRRAASSRQWPVGDRAAFRTWQSVIYLLSVQCEEILREKHNRGLVSSKPLTAQDIMLRGHLDLDGSSFADIRKATTLQVSILGTWDSHPDDYSEWILHLRHLRHYEVDSLIEETIDGHFPQYAAL